MRLIGVAIIKGYIGQIRIVIIFQLTQGPPEICIPEKIISVKCQRVDRTCVEIPALKALNFVANPLAADFLSLERFAKAHIQSHGQRDTCFFGYDDRDVSKIFLLDSSAKKH